MVLVTWPDAKNASPEIPTHLKCVHGFHPLMMHTSELLVRSKSTTILHTNGEFVFEQVLRFESHVLLRHYHAK